MPVMRGDGDPDAMLVLRQVILSLALPFALVPLIILSARKSLMGRYVLKRVELALAALAALGVILVDVGLVAVSLG